jgi:hypothetical protein
MGGALVAALLVVAVLAPVPGCDDDEDWGENTGAPCGSAADCYPALDQSELSGDVVCLDLVEGGYCTHTCSGDGDCCALEGECESDLEQVCSPFESTESYYCFLSCEGEEDGDSFCHEWAHSEFICRSSGGGSDNEKVCVPPG